MITATHLMTNTVIEIAPHNFMADASTLGWRPGNFPHIIPTELGNKQPFVRTRVVHENGSLEFCEYTQQIGCLKLKVWND